MRFVFDFLGDIASAVEARRCAACREPRAASPVFCDGCVVLLDAAPAHLVAPSRDASLFLHAGPLRDAIHRAKYGADPYVAALLARLFDDVAAEYRGLATVLLPVPLHPYRLRARGFNVPALFAKRLGARAAVAVSYGLRRVRNTAAQVALSVNDRAANVRDAFFAEDVRGHDVLLVDDVRTTGATLCEARLACERAGANSVRTLSLAFAPDAT